MTEGGIKIHMYEQEEKIIAAENNFSDNHVDFYTSDYQIIPSEPPFLHNTQRIRNIKKKKKKTIWNVVNIERPKPVSESPLLFS